MREKTFKNSPKGRSEIPGRVGEYMLLDIHGKNIRGDTYGWKRTENLRVRIKDEHYAYVFKYIKIRYGKDEHGNQIGKKLKRCNNMTENIKIEPIDKDTTFVYNINNIYNIKNKKSDVLLGVVKWYGVLREWCFFPINATVYSAGCTKDIGDFISKLMEERKNRLGKNNF